MQPNHIKNINFGALLGFLENYSLLFYCKYKIWRLKTSLNFPHVNTEEWVTENREDWIHSVVHESKAFFSCIYKIHIWPPETTCFHCLLQITSPSFCSSFATLQVIADFTETAFAFSIFQPWLDRKCTVVQKILSRHKPQQEWWWSQK